MEIHNEYHKAIKGKTVRKDKLMRSRVRKKKKTPSCNSLLVMIPSPLVCLSAGASLSRTGPPGRLHDLSAGTQLSDYDPTLICSDSPADHNTPVRCSWHHLQETVTSKQISDNGEHLNASVMSRPSVM